MGWIKLHTVNGPEVHFNVDHIAYVAAPPEDEAARGVGADIAMIDNTDEVIKVTESPEDIMGFLYWEEKQKCGR